MKTLSSSLRRLLERTVIEARDVAETGARAALKALAVQYHEPYGHMTPEQRSLRRWLRAHARQLGDRRDARSGTQAIDHLVHECAYEHWHGMLFARFLAENHVLIEPEMGVAITLDECEESGQRKKTSTSGRLRHGSAHRMLPQVFRPNHPALKVRFAPEHRLKLEKLVEGLPERCVHGDGLSRLGISILAVQEEGRGQPLRGQDRGGRVADGDTALHRTIHGAVSPPQLAWRVVDESASWQALSHRSHFPAQD